MKTQRNSRPDLLAILALLAKGLVAGAVTFTNDTRITPTDTSFDGQDISITNCTVTVDGSHTFASMHVLNGGILTHAFDTNLQPTVTGLDLFISNNVEIEIGGALDVSGKGYAGGAGLGPGASRQTNSPYAFTAGSGGGYGGFGGSSSTYAPGGNSYGSIPNPINKGSGGGTGVGVGGVGGGAIKVVAGGLLRVDGQILANGANGIHAYSGGGAGGSIWLSATNIIGRGSISANGGAGEPYNGGGGGGGRIAIYIKVPLLANANHFNSSLSAHGGPGATGGGAGTIYLRGSDPVAQLLIDNGGMLGTNTPLGSFEMSDLTISGRAMVQSGPTPPIHNLLIHSNSWLRQITRLVLNVVVTGNASIDAESGITADGGGFPAGQGQGRGGVAVSSSPTGTTWGGGGYGGYGGASLSNAPGGLAYGSAIEPTDFGSGGGGEGSSGGAGGGVVRLQVQGRLDLQGQITANGANGIRSGGGGGSGGGLVIFAGVLSGDGTISANGGAGESKYGGGGGGGRIQFQLGTNLFAGVISAHGGAGGHYGGAGTVYERVEARLPQLIVDNGGVLGTNTLIPMTVPGLDLQVQGGGLVVLSNLQTFHNLALQSNGWLVAAAGNFTRPINVSGNASIGPGAGILFDGKGNGPDRGPGAPNAARYAAGGGGYGGYGGSSSFGVTGGSGYGSASAPEQAGSGGGSSIIASAGFGGGAGGGSLQLKVIGTLLLDGIISANGTAAGLGGGGGSGGSIWVTAGNFLGSGTVSANGGAGDGQFGGGGGGGRIAIVCSTNRFQGSMVAYGGPGAVYGGAGTVFLTTQRAGASAQIFVDNGGWPGAGTLLSLFPIPLGTDLTVTHGATVVTPSEGFTLSLGSLRISSNAWLTVPSLPQSPTFRLNLTRPSRIEAGGGINLDGKGNLFGQGAGRFLLTQAFGYTGGGGGHGGNGGTSIANAGGGDAYGSAVQPTEPGSGGGAENPAVFGAAGGGALVITASDSVVLDGLISANGAAANSPGGGGGSGGSIALNVGSLIGSGQIAANGGDGDFARGGGGSGGRIAVYSGQQTKSNEVTHFSGTLQAYGGAGFVNGGAGTIYEVGTGLSTNRLLVVDNGGGAGAVTPLPGLDSGAELHLRGGALAFPVSSTRWNAVAIDSGATLIQARTATNLEVTVFGDLFIGTNGLISADAKGFSGLNGGPGAGSMVVNASGSGGGYGGRGGASASGAPGGGAYGSADQPTDRGSRGGIFPTLTNFSRGGGAIRLEVAGALTLNGAISADGEDARLESSGGAAGGSIWITARKLTGAGSISANGGAGDPAEGGGGGGGRVALYTGTNFHAGVVTAFGGTGINPGNDGTIVIDELPPFRILSQTPTDIVSHPVSTINLVLSSPLDLMSISNAGFILETPSTSISPPDLHLVQLAPARFELTFPAQNTLGYYQLQITRGLQDVFGVAMSQPYQGSFLIMPPVISGRVIDTNNLPISHVTLTAGGDFLPTLTDTNGAYALQVTPGWTGTLSPSRTGWLFVPRFRSYEKLGDSVTNQDFVMVASPNLQVTQRRTGGNVNLQWFGIIGVTYQALASTNLIDWCPCQPVCQGSNQLMGVTLPLGGEPVQFLKLQATY